MSYELGWEDEAGAGDNVVESNGVKLYVDQHSAPYLTGSEIDFVETAMMGAGFAVKNPTVKPSCACGQSPPFYAVGFARRLYRTYPERTGLARLHRDGHPGRAVERAAA